LSAEGTKSRLLTFFKAVPAKGCTMLRGLAAMVLLLVATPGANAGGASGIAHRVSCTVVRFYVAKYSASAAEMWARSHGASDAEIENARHCLKDAPAQTVQAAQWTGQ
jgi:hypothetical protein